MGVLISLVCSFANEHLLFDTHNKTGTHPMSFRRPLPVLGSNPVFDVVILSSGMVLSSRPSGSGIKHSTVQIERK